ncbi:LOW QUALITY PROTEIN: conserved hypothetical protein, partial [Streptomyces sp. SPB78]
MLLAHLSDLHLDGTEQAAARARAAVDRVRAAGDAVDALLVTGDLADHGAESEYEEVAAVLAGLPFPVLTCPGNHDERRAYRKVLRDGATGDGPVDELHVLRRDGAPALAVLMCDSSIPGAGAGALSPETLAWIDTSLTALPDEVPAVLAFHPPGPPPPPAPGRPPPHAPRRPRGPPRPPPARPRPPHGSRAHRRRDELRGHRAPLGPGRHVHPAPDVGGRGPRGRHPAARTRLPRPRPGRAPRDDPLPRRGV